MLAVKPTGQKPMTADKYSTRYFLLYRHQNVQIKSEYDWEMPRIQTKDNHMVFQGKNTWARTKPKFKKECCNSKGSNLQSVIRGPFLCS